MTKAMRAQPCTNLKFTELPPFLTKWFEIWVGRSQKRAERNAVGIMGWNGHVPCDDGEQLENGGRTKREHGLPLCAAEVPAQFSAHNQTAGPRRILHPNLNDVLAGVTVYVFLFVVLERRRLDYDDRLWVHWKLITVLFQFNWLWVRFLQSASLNGR